MTQNIYDSPPFFEKYSQFKRSKYGLVAAPEWPQLQEMLPTMQGKKVLDLGCGFGWFARWAAEEGAHAILGIDLSEKMLDKAVSLTKDDRIRYMRADISDFILAERPFDIVFSSLAIHYIADFENFVMRARKHIITGGHFVFSIEHPLLTAPSTPIWQETAGGKPIWPLNNYSVEGKRETDWLTKGVIKYHRTISHYVNSTIRHGFNLARLVEWVPTEKDIEKHPEWRQDIHRPMFLLLSAVAV